MKVVSHRDPMSTRARDVPIVQEMCDMWHSGKHPFSLLRGFFVERRSHQKYREKGESV